MSDRLSKLFCRFARRPEECKSKAPIRCNMPNWQISLVDINGGAIGPSLEATFQSKQSLPGTFIIRNSSTGHIIGNMATSTSYDC
jgi:hypothetical protein